MKNCYEMQTGSGQVLRFRLTAFQTKAYIKGGDFPPHHPALAAVVTAIQDVGLLCSLMTHALRGVEGNALTDGDKAYDLLVDEGWNSDDFARLVVNIADASGLIPAGQMEELMTACTAGENGIGGQCRTMIDTLNGVGGQEAEPESGDPTSRTP